MTERSISHGAFTIERLYKASPAKAFAAWATIEAKRRWFAGEAPWIVSEHRMDFRSGGSERLISGLDGAPHTFEARYSEVIPDVRIIYTYDMWLSGALLSTSLVTVEFQPQGTGTRMVFTEHGAFLDGLATAKEREEGTLLGFVDLDSLVES